MIIQWLSSNVASVLWGCFLRCDEANYRRHRLLGCFKRDAELAVVFALLDRRSRVPDLNLTQLIPRPADQVDDDIRVRSDALDLLPDCP